VRLVVSGLRTCADRAALIDITENRPALGRQHPKCKSLLEEYMHNSLVGMNYGTRRFIQLSQVQQRKALTLDLQCGRHNCDTPLMIGIAWYEFEKIYQLMRSPSVLYRVQTKDTVNA
jgi:hypothetical protein